MKIGLISDTHAAGNGHNIPERILRALDGVDLILHCGDLECLGVLDYLETVAPVLAVRGYEDPMEPGDRLARITRVVQAEGVSIGMIHDIQWPGPRIVPTGDGSTLAFPAGDPDELMAKKFGQKVDVVVFGDTHHELIHQYGGVLLVNPGSPTYPAKRHSTGELGTIGMLEIRGESVTARLIDLEAFGRPA
ncbi:MAG: metallophosphoesterase family protein [Chloroflexi bacterium]|nr:metallophosphoesterase family protein [Chloroflexota bacterium]